MNSANFELDSNPPNSLSLLLWKRISRKLESIGRSTSKWKTQYLLLTLRRHNHWIPYDITDTFRQGMFELVQPHRNKRGVDFQGCWWVMRLRENAGRGLKRKRGLRGKLIEFQKSSLRVRFIPSASKLRSAESAIGFGGRLQRHQSTGLRIVGSCSIPTAPTKISQILLPFRTSAFLPSCACQAKRLHASNGDAPGRRSLPPMSVSYHVAVGWQRETRYPH